MKQHKLTPVICARCAVLTALIIVGAYIKIPLPPVPFTLQSFFVILGGLTLGAGCGAAAVALYVFMGLVGIPIFSGGGGFGYVLTPTFGYIIGFLVAAYVGGKIAAASNKFSRLLCAAFAATAIVYIFGMGYYYVMQTMYFKEAVDIGKFLWSFGAITAPKDIILCPIIAAISMRLRKVL